MPTPSGHTDAIRASRVIGTTVYNTAGDNIGTIEDVMLEKTRTASCSRSSASAASSASARNTMPSVVGARL